MACGVKCIAEGGVQIRVSSEGKAGFGGVLTCGRVWSCPVCSAKIMDKRQKDLAACLRAWLVGDRAKTVFMLTLTMRHHAGMSLVEVKTAMQDAWRRMTQRKGWKDAKAGLNWSHMVRSMEATHSEQGWHLHFHVLLLVDGNPKWSKRRSFYLEIVRLWADVLQRKGYSATREGQDLKKMTGGVEKIVKDASGYVTVVGTYDEEAVRSASLEVARGDLKDSRLGGRSPFGILREILQKITADGDLDAVAADVAIWHEWEKHSAGMRAITWSDGMRAELLPVEEIQEKSDEEIAAEETGTNLDTVLLIPGKAWSRFVRSKPGATSELVMVCEDAHLAYAGNKVQMQWWIGKHLTQQGVSWSLPEGFGAEHLKKSILEGPLRH